ncbi:secondary thiamine-phosphate synthase enzyme YjbQ [Salinigranum sp. GCM10025319]|uniref:secondary thiamine-phosphate synthase enzyme YjbQ n=1 Tax=Salinigranum sp. GCM10025319 TaxID=3252687 RepID=UPI00361C67E2
MPRFDVSTDARLTVVDVTDEVREAIADSALDEGEHVCTVFSEHTTAGVVVNEAESRLLGDVESYLEQAVPDSGWDHDTLDGNADSHLRALLLGNSASVPVVDGDLALGRWQSILLVECDGPRDRTLRVVVR